MGTLMRFLGRRQGTFMVEWALVVASAVIMMLVMGPYIKGAFRALLKLIEVKGNSSMHDARPW